MIHSDQLSLAFQKISPAYGASPQILNLTLSQSEADAWMYLGALFAAGSVEVHDCWAETRHLVDYCGGEQALKALDMLIASHPSVDIGEDSVDPWFSGHEEDALFERLKSAAEMWVTTARPARVFDILKFLNEAEKAQSELRGRLFAHWSNVTAHREELVRSATHSPIEEALGLELVRRGCMVVPPRNVGTVLDFERDRSIPAVLYVQRTFEQYRADFFVTKPGCGSGFVVECDGHAFHEKTKEQAARDKQRDRWFLSRGFPTMRFTGSELFNQVGRCADEVLGQIAAFA